MCCHTSEASGDKYIIALVLQHRHRHSHYHDDLFHVKTVPLTAYLMLS